LGVGSRWADTERMHLLQQANCRVGRPFGWISSIPARPKGPSM